MRIRTLVVAGWVLLVPTVLLAQQPASTTSPPAAIHHVVKRGDTLWDIAKQYLKDPFRWPEVFHHNMDVVKNPHWIYPGEVLTIASSEVRPDVVARADSNGYVVARVATRPAPAETPADAPTVFAARSTTPTEPRSATQTRVRSATYTVRPGDHDAAPFVTAPGGPGGAGRVIGGVERLGISEGEQSRFQLNDRLYVTVPAGHTLLVGDRVAIFRQADDIANVGRVLVPTGVAMVDAVTRGGPATVRIVKQYGEIRVKQLTLPFDASFTPTTVLPVNGNYPLRTKVIWLENQPVLPTLQHYLVLGVAPSAGVREGDRFTLYDEPRLDVGGTVAPVPTATVEVVRVTPFAATAIIVDQSQPKVQAGMAAWLTAKMP